MPTTANFTNAYHELYDNYFLSMEVEKLIESKLAIERMCDVDNTLEGGPGFIKKIRKYVTVGDAQDLEMGEGNDEGFEVSFIEKAYTTKLTQAMGKWFDEQVMNDANLLPTMTRKMASTFTNRLRNEIYTEWLKATNTVKVSAFNFDAFVDAKATLDITGSDATGEMSPKGGAIFAICHPKDVAAIRKSLKDELKYVEAYVRTGYVGHICGIPLLQKVNAKEGVIVVATKKAVTIFNKKGMDVERDRKANERENYIYMRKYYIAALTDDTQVYVMYTGANAPTPEPSDPNGKYDLTSANAKHTGKTPKKPTSPGVGG